MSDHIQFCRRERLPEDPLTLAESLLISRHTIVSMEAELRRRLAAHDDAAKAYTLLETQVAALRAALERLTNEASGFYCMADRPSHGSTNMRVMFERIQEARAALAASPAAKPNCETCGKPHPCWCPAPDARPAANCVPHKEKE